MRRLVFVSTCAAVPGIIVSAHLWRELQVERRNTEVTRQQSSEHQESVSASAPNRAVSEVVSLGRELEPKAPSAASDKSPPTTNGWSGYILHEKEMMRDPEYRKARLVEAVLSARRMYPGLAEELGLNAEETTRLYDFLAQSQLEINDVSILAIPFNNMPPDPAEAEEAMRRRADAIRRQGESLQSMLGSDRYSMWQEYQQTLGARFELKRIGGDLEGLGVPMSSEQFRRLTDTYNAEQKRLRDELQWTVSSAQQPGSANREAMIEERNRVQAESNLRIIEAAKPYLNPDQLDALQASLDRELIISSTNGRLKRL